MRLDPSSFFRGLAFAVIFIVLASSALLRTTNGIGGVDQAYAAEETTLKEKVDHLPCDVNENYPDKVLQWCGWITHFANLNGFSPDLIAGLIWYESGGDPTAYSRSGAVGLMQVMPRDGLAASFICVNGPCFASRPTIKELEDPYFNLEYGTRMLAGLVNRHQSLREGLKSYGPAGAGYTYADKVISIYERFSGD
jgi:soluble lytic murein transglycosylase-like protein